VRVGGRVPVRVALQHQLVLGRVVRVGPELGDPVGPVRQRVPVVCVPVVVGARPHRPEHRHRHREVEVAAGLVQVVADQPLVDALDRLQPLAVVVPPDPGPLVDPAVRVVIRARLVVLQVLHRIGRGGLPVRQLGEPPLDPVLQVLAGDRLAVLPPGPRLEGELPDRVALARPAGVGGQVGHQLAAGRPGLRPEPGQGPGDLVADVELQRLLHQLRVEVVRPPLHAHPQRPPALRLLRRAGVGGLAGGRAQQRGDRDGGRRGPAGGPAERPATAARDGGPGGQRGVHNRTL
jgi:hypothetical protein